MEVQEITKKLAHWGYPKELIVKSYLKAKNQDRKNLLEMEEKPNKQQKNKIRLITTYNKYNPPMKDILERFKDYFLQNRKGIDFQNIQTVYQRAPNLRDKLVRGQVIKELKLGIPHLAINHASHAQRWTTVMLLCQTLILATKYQENIIVNQEM